ncbi:putative bifunctional diguanylate cyclase/phosphodiesterase [Sneathiella litorea]|uniref:EAL domain-containing protein n=1 Tax=Sneathiella litorea TaxID=2606216 RepID=A0A6L8W5X6_9PROT|nr:bifunctional diguanylate cyclase/phosphodiesterase [Sneathiella litorea]MZR30139.1 EAL domain-containing protein [Sneathiella litorea]
MNTRGLASKQLSGHSPAGIHRSAAPDNHVLKLNYSKLQLLILEPDDYILNFCDEINIPVAAHEAIYSDSVAKDIAAGVYNCIIIDGTRGSNEYKEILTEVSNKPPFLPVIVIDGSLNFLRAGASENIASNDLTAERLETALFNADRLCKLNNRTAILEMELSAFIEEDPLTALPGRSKFRVRMAKAIEKAHSAKKSVSLIILDLNSFKELNESRGHDFGDEVLKTVAKRLFKFAPYNSIVGRLGDDEFALLAVDQDSSPEASDIAARLMHEIRKPYIIKGQKTDVSATIGLAQLDDHDTADGLLHKSISALYSAKRDKTHFTVYTHQDDLERRQQLRLAQDLPDAVKNNQLVLNYQPIVRISDQQVIGVEALVRWQHPKQGLIFPDSFIPLAEGSGSIDALTEWVLEQTIIQGSSWLAQGTRLSVSVNISALILHNPAFPDMVAKKLEKTGFPAGLLKLEITESAIISDVSRATEIVTRLHEMGVRLSIDDFGTGYTSLAYLRKLPFDEIKIDKSFVLNMTQVADDEVIVRTLLDLAKSLGLSVVAEGVEDARTWKVLEALDCDVAQGYFMSRPIDLEAFNSWIITQPWKDELK